MKKLALLLILAVLVSAAASTAFAGTFNASGFVGPGDPTLLVGIIVTPNCTGGYGGVDVFYDIYEFQVDTDGSYTVSVFSASGNTAFYLIANTFDPGAVATNCIAASNTGNPQVASAPLTAGSTYFVVIIDDTFAQTGHNYDLTISGPGEIYVGGLPTVPACPYPLPAGSVIRSVPAGAPTFFAPDLGSQISNLTLPPGTWYISEIEGDFALVWIACQAQPIYIPVNTIAP